MFHDVGCLLPCVAHQRVNLREKQRHFIDFVDEIHAASLVGPGIQSTWIPGPMDSRQQARLWCQPASAVARGTQ